MKKIPLIVVAGPTASGKTALGVEISKRFDGEVISADSMQIYKGMNIATAKPSREEMRGIPHHLIDFVSPENSFSVADFKALAEEKIDDIVRRKKFPVIVGGTGLYIDSLVENITLNDAPVDEGLRKALAERAEKEGAAVLLEEVREIDPEYAEKLHENNLKRIIRVLELWHTSHITMTRQIELSHKNPSPYNVCYIVLDVRSRDCLYERINRRVDSMLEAGLLKEAEEYYGSCGKTSAQAIGYKELAPYFNGEKTLGEAVESLKQSTRRYAKRQLTWFRKNETAHRIYIDGYESQQSMIDDAVSVIENSGVTEG